MPTHNKRLFVTFTGYIRVGPYSLARGDQMYITKAADVPFVLREDQATGHHYNVGEAYVYGIMGGELMDGSRGFHQYDIEEFP